MALSYNREPLTSCACPYFCYLQWFLLEQQRFQALCAILRASLISNSRSKSAFLFGGLRIQLAASYTCEAEQASAKQD
jgi:hypothetical protein